MAIDYRKTHFDLYQFFGGYLNQSWKEIYIWEGNEPTYPPIIRKFRKESSRERIDKTISQLKDIIKIGKGCDEDGWMDILTWGLSLGYYPPGVGLTYEEWLEDVLGILEEPMEDTLKHWIPKRIRE